MAENSRKCIVCYENFDKTFTDAHSFLEELSSQRLAKVSSCTEGWLATSKEPERTIAENVSKVLQLQSHVEECKYYYHSKCYIKFANEAKLKRTVSFEAKGSSVKKAKSGAETDISASVQVITSNFKLSRP